MAGVAEGIRPQNHVLQSVRTLAGGGCVGPDTGGDYRGLRRRGSDDRQHGRSGSSARGELKKSHPDRCMGRSRGGLTTKVHALVDGRGLPL